VTDPATPRPYVYHLLLVSLLLLFPLHAFESSLEGLGVTLLTLGTAFVILSCMVAVGRTRGQRILGLLLGAPAAVTTLMRLGEPDEVGGWGELLSLGILLHLIVVLMLTVARERRFTLSTVSASLSVYLLIGFAWATLYGGVYMADPAAFDIPTTLSAASKSAESMVQDERSGLFYFSFVTLSTLGYGDITPVSPVAMALATMEAIVGQLFLVVVVAATVAKSVAQDQRTKAHGEP
jgi:hypothetical protein